jgi:hypothetical protein
MEEFVVLIIRWMISIVIWYAAFHKFYGRYNDLIYPYNISLGHMLSDMFHNNR